MARWLNLYGAQIIHPPKRNSRRPWSSKRLRRWVAGTSARQIVESVYDKLFNTFSVCGGSGPTSFRVCGLVWRQG
jgi:hypothetical protein